MTKKGHFSGKRRMPTLPTATKEQKVQKIRNAEYYDFQGVQDTLYTQSKENKVFRKLMTIILSEENIMLAYRNIKKNVGSHTPGVDGKTIKDLSKWQEDSLITYIRTRLKHYIPQPVIYALSNFLIMILSWLVKQSLRAFLFQEVQL